MALTNSLGLSLRRIQEVSIRRYQAENPLTQRSRGQFAEFAEFAAQQSMNPEPMADAARKRAASGVADWHVSLTDTDRR